MGVGDVLHQCLILGEGSVTTDKTVVLAGAAPNVAVRPLQVLQQLRTVVKKMKF